MFWVYVLRSESTGHRYTGSCADLETRLAEHNRGKSLSTRHGVPWRLVYQESFATRAEAVRRERYLKMGHGREEPDRLLKGSG